MNKKNTEYLFNTYPKLFKHIDNMQASLMFFGFACGDGWFNLINKLCSDITKWYDNHETNILDDDWNVIGKGKGIPRHFYITQIKEKFGSLRFYISAAPNEIHDMIYKAEHDSYYICEQCGKDIRLEENNQKQYNSYYRDTLPWILTLCDDCLKKHLEKRGLPFKPYISDWQKKNKAPFKEMKEA